MFHFPYLISVHLSSSHWSASLNFNKKSYLKILAQQFCIIFSKDRDKKTCIVYGWKINNSVIQERRYQVKLLLLLTAGKGLSFNLKNKEKNGWLFIYEESWKISDTIGLSKGTPKFCKNSKIHFACGAKIKNATLLDFCSYWETVRRNIVEHNNHNGVPWWIVWYQIVLIMSIKSRWDI